MCGIVGFTGEHQAAPIILDGLSKLEYRGYDSAGVRQNQLRAQPPGAGVVRHAAGELLREGALQPVQ